jgi:hypothetical protein
VLLKSVEMRRLFSSWFWFGKERKKSLFCFVKKKNPILDFSLALLWLNLLAKLSTM